MSRCILAPSARLDLKEISSYIARFNLMRLEDSTRKLNSSVNCWLIFLIWGKVAIILAVVYGVSR